MVMEIEIIAKTGNGSHSTKNDVDQTAEEVMEIAKKINGNIVYGRGYVDGTMIVVEK
jgi:hypothetical protein